MIFLLLIDKKKSFESGKMKASDDKIISTPGEKNMT